VFSSITRLTTNLIKFVYNLEGVHLISIYSVTELISGRTATYVTVLRLFTDVLTGMDQNRQYRNLHVRTTVHSIVLDTYLVFGRA
jgi:hypothetical protein